MSIFPKKITYGENVIIHLRFINSKDNNRLIKYFLNVYNPKKELIYDTSESIILGYGENYYNEIYHSIMIQNDFLPGKYMVDFYLEVNGKKIDSLTKNNDYFYVEKLVFYKKRKKIFLENISDETTSCILYGNKKKKMVLEGNKIKNVNDEYQYIEYGNNQIFKIE